MAGHTSWRELKAKTTRAPQTEQWSLVVRRTYRPWWTFWLVRRTDSLVACKLTSQEEALALCAELKAESPKCDFELRRS
jgi:hypothetical protein